MDPNQDLRILQPSHQASVLDFAKQQLSAQCSDPMELELQSWTARWRAEALERYLSSGWSYGLFDEGERLKGFILAQPLLFFRGHTQTLWVESLQTRDPADAKILLDIVCAWARDKHFQCVVLEDSAWAQSLSQGPRQVLAAGLIEIKTARY